MWGLGSGRRMAVDAPAVAKSSPYFSNQWKSTLTLLFQNKPSAPGITYDAISRLIAFEWAQGWGLGDGWRHGGRCPCCGINSPYIFNQWKSKLTYFFFSKPCAPDFGNDGTSRPESVDWALERHGRQKRPWWTQCRLRQSYDDFMVEGGLRLFFDFL